MIGEGLTTQRLAMLALILAIALLSNLYFRPYQWYNLGAIVVIGAVLSLCIVLLAIRLRRQ